ncbi:hypothetical protein [Paenibacillus macerans]|uniref:hypothetical protein n=1 Tax=Paenibacillus macerans TaxID=44252 RepID=UPI00203DDD18|nr:hypothetical protein [Paenibacillus macerans]MCM3703760.1 hypothetical protein [Paenibacillus macerans]
MKVGFARTAAAQWVTEHAAREAEFLGAYFSGSTVDLPNDAPMSPSSDIDLMVVTAQTEPPPKPGKFLFENTLLEVTYLSWSQLASAENVLTDYHLAGNFRTDTIIADPTGRLRKLQKEVAPRFAERPWVRRRCENARERVERGLRSIDPSAPWHDQVTAWLFPTGIMTHVLLTAALRNPTVRLRYLAARQVLADYELSARYPELLRLLGCTQLGPQQAESHLDALARTFDAAAEHARTPFFFSSDITAAARPVAIDGSRELIRNGRQQEAVFWIVATFARCLKILAADAPALHKNLLPGFNDMLADLGINGSAHLLARAGEGLRYLPRLMQAAEAIMDANPEIKTGQG